MRRLKPWVCVVGTSASHRSDGRGVRVEDPDLQACLWMYVGVVDTGPPPIGNGLGEHKCSCLTQTDSTDSTT